MNKHQPSHLNQQPELHQLLHLFNPNLLQRLQQCLLQLKMNKINKKMKSRMKTMKMMKNRRKMKRRNSNLKKINLRKMGRIINYHHQLQFLLFQLRNLQSRLNPQNQLNQQPSLLLNLLNPQNQLNLQSLPNQPLNLPPNLQPNQLPNQLPNPQLNGQKKMKKISKTGNKNSFQYHCQVFKQALTPWLKMKKHRE